MKAWKDLAHWWRERMRKHALDWRSWAENPDCADYAKDALDLAVSCRNAAQRHERKRP